MTPQHSTFGPCHGGKFLREQESRWVLNWAFLWPYKGVPFPLMNAWITIAVVSHDESHKSPCRGNGKETGENDE
jgi:hypothetical protein